MWNISIFNNKAPPLSLQRVEWSPFRYCHYFYYHSQCLKTKIEFVFGGVVLADSGQVFPFTKMKALFISRKVWVEPIRNYHCFNYHRECLWTKIMFVWGCGASRQWRSISISKSKGFLYFFKGLSGAHLDITIVLSITANVWEENKVCVGVWC